MTQEELERHVMEGAERWKTLKDRQYQLKFPAGVYASDMAMCALLADIQGTDEYVTGRIERAAEQLARMRVSGALGSALSVCSDATVMLAIANIRDVSPAPIGCEHVGNDGKCADCTGDSTVECKGCDTFVIEAKGHACKDVAKCENFYCDSCAKDCINAQGYCDDCSTFECTWCDSHVDRDTQKKCANADCADRPDYCEECAPALLNEQGLCATCSGEEKQDCSSCVDRFTSSRLTKCKNAEGCTNSYCAKCKEASLSDSGYCVNCNTIDCTGCMSEFERGDVKRCGGADCGKVYCERCAEALLNDSGLCSGCSLESDETCSGCNETFHTARLSVCNGKDCANKYCPDCSARNLPGGLCQVCTESPASL